MGIVGGIRFLGDALSQGLMMRRGLKLRSLNRAIDGGLFCSEFCGGKGRELSKVSLDGFGVILALQLNPVVNNLPYPKLCSNFRVMGDASNDQ